MNKVLALLLIFSLAFNIAFVGIWIYVRTTRPGGPPPQPAQRSWPAARRPAAPRADGRRWAALRLTPQQRQHLEQSLQNVRRRIAELNEQVRKERERLFDLLAQDPIDREAVEQVQQRIDAAQREIRELVLREMMNTCQVLTPEQRRRWAAMMKTLDHGRRGWMPPGPRPAPQTGPPPADPPHGPPMMAH